MKLTFLLLTLLIGGCCKVEAQYHIRVECFGVDRTFNAYYIRFTPDNWKTSYPLMEAIDNTVQGVVCPIDRDIFFQEDIFLDDNNSESQAISFAKKFKSYYDCCKWNERQKKIYLKMYAYRKAHPPHSDLKLIPKKQKCCTVTQVY